MKIVQVLEIPVRYNGETYQPGSSFEMETAHVNETLVEVTGEVEKIPKAIEEMTVPELKDHAAENSIDLGEAKKRDEILAAIQSAENEKDLLE